MLIDTTYTKNLHQRRRRENVDNFTAAGEKILLIDTTYKGIYIDFAAPQVRKFCRLIPHIPKIYNDFGSFWKFCFYFPPMRKDVGGKFFHFPPMGEVLGGK